MDSILSTYLTGVSLGAPVSHGGMTVFPVFAPLVEEKYEYLTMSEAMEDLGVLHITEISEAGDVPELMAVNTGKATILMIDGELLVGAKQDRALNTTILLPPESKTVIPVSCIEHGRWNYTSREFHSTEYGHMSSESRRRKMRSVSESLKQGGSFASDQGEVWNSVHNLNRKSGAQSSTDAMKDGFAAKKLDIDNLIGNFPVQPHQQGILIFHNANVVGMEILSREDVFLKLYDKFMRSFAIDGSFLESLTVRKSVLPTNAKAFLTGVTNCYAESFPSVGLGRDYRFTGKGMIGSGLVHGNEVIHLSFCAAEEPSYEPGNERDSGTGNQTQ